MPPAVPPSPPPQDSAAPALEGRDLPRFAAAVAHEVRNPLSAVKIALQTLARQATLDPKDSTRLQIALREVATIERVLSDMLEWARPSELRLEPVSPRALADAAVVQARPALEEYGVALRREERENLPLVRVDAELVSRALAELLRNAAQVTPAGGEIHLTLRARQCEALLEVDDQGPGLAAEDAARVFDPFFSRRARGLGLGLPRAREIARRHGGDVRLRARRSAGTRATLLLPALLPLDAEGASGGPPAAGEPPES